MSNRRSVLMWGLVVILALILLYNQRSGNQARIRDTKQSQIDLCLAQNSERSALRDYISAQIDRAEKSIPTLNYYQHHPVELGRALSNLASQRAETRRVFAPIPC